MSDETPKYKTARDLARLCLEAASGDLDQATAAMAKLGWEAKDDSVITEIFEYGCREILHELRRMRNSDTIAALVDGHEKGAAGIKRRLLSAYGFRLKSGKALGDATAQEVLAQAIELERQAAGFLEHAAWMRAIAAAMPKRRPKTVREVLSEEQLRALYPKKKKKDEG